MEFYDLFKFDKSTGDDTDKFRDVLFSTEFDGKYVDLGGYEYLLTEPLEIPEGKVIHIKNGTLLFDMISNKANFCILANDADIYFDDVVVRDERDDIHGMNGIMCCIGGSLRIRGGAFVGDGNFGIYAHEIHAPRISNVRFSGMPTAVQLAGCRHGYIGHCIASDCGFAFSVIGKEYTDNAESSFYMPIKKPVEWSIGNVIFACHAERCSGTPFNINGTNAGVILACTDSENASDYSSFQIKHPTNKPDAMFNKIALCHAQHVETGYYTQGSGKTLLLGNSSYKTQHYGTRLNWTEDSLVIGQMAEDFGQELLENEKAILGGFSIRNSKDCLLDACYVDDTYTMPEDSDRVVKVHVSKSEGIELGQMIGIT